MTTPASTATVAVPYSAADPVLAARALRPVIEAHATQSEAERRLAAPVVAALVESDLFRLWVPAAVGGAEASLETFVRVVEEIAAADGAAGWNLAIGASGALVSGRLPLEVMRTLFGTPASIVAGSFNMRGKVAALKTPAAYVLSGQWGFGSGCQQAKWLGGTGAVVENGAPRLLPDGSPEPFMFLFPREQAEVLDTWNVMGMRGTGSHDYKVERLEIPFAHALSLIAPPTQPGPLYRFPLTTLLGLALAPVASGMARAAIDALKELAGAKRPAGSPALLRERPAVQAQVAKAEGLARSARAFMLDAVGEVWREVADAGRPVTMDHRALLRLVATHVTQTAAQVVDLMYDAGGATSFHQSSKLERLFRDAHVATQHAMVSTASLEPIGRVLLGLEPGTPRF